MRRLCVLLAALVLLSVGAAAYELPADFTGRTLEDVTAEFMEAYSLNENNFSISYYNTVTQEAYAFNDTWFSIAASTYKLPLNMVFYEMQRDGEITGDTIITWTGRTLDDIHEQSIVNSNNELSEALMYYWGDHVSYKEQLRRYFTMTDEEIEPCYWQANWFCTRMMMDCLRYLYDNQDDFQELIGYMKQAMPGQYFKRGVTDYEVAHKYGSVQIYNNDVGIIYTPQPFLLAVYTQGGSIGGDGICAEAARLMTAYNLWQAEQSEPEPEPEPEPEDQQGHRELPVETLPLPQEEAPAEEAPVEEVPVEETLPEEPQAEPSPPEQAQRKGQLLIPAAGLAALLAAVLLVSLVRKKKRSNKRIKP